MFGKENKKPVKKPKKESGKEDWMQSKWRPMMGWMYMSVCMFDFIVAPILWTVVQFWEMQVVNDAFRQWQPLTLQGGGLFHVAMGAVLGVSAYGRTQEKLVGASTVDTTHSPPTSPPMAISSPSPMPISSSPMAGPAPSIGAPKPLGPGPSTNMPAL
jgi:hypothetical protein